MVNYNPKNFLILAVDDNAVNRILLDKLLTKEGYNTKFFANGEDAMSSLEKINPDLILLDLMMPKINGLELCEQIKLNPHFQEIPIIFITASDDKKDLLKAFDLGAVDYIMKPFHNQELLARVKNHMELKFTRDELKKALVELEKLAKTDELTGISNRRNFLALAQREFHLAKRQKRVFSLLILDIDYFKRINDTYGHPVGDYVIIYVAKECVKCLRKEDLCARWGGEEFIIFLSETNLKEALIVANRIRRNIENQNIVVESYKINVTVSVGVCAYGDEAESIDYIISCADKALLKAKKNGKNQVVTINNC
ncbi:diguanylate cyclase [Geminocystis sp.]|uniref:diguanylate cyclase n=1 Tax=Geminocystis sp. TaxID=2664100 RepID=UPI003593426C